LQIVLLVLILNYCVVRELGRVVGGDKLFKLFFGARPNLGADRPSAQVR